VRRTDMQMAFVLMLLSCLSIQAIALDPGTIAVPSITGANMDMPKPLITPPSMDMANSPTKVTVVEGKRDPFSDGSPFNETETSEADKVSGDWTVRFANRSDVSLGLDPLGLRWEQGDGLWRTERGPGEELRICQRLLRGRTANAEGQIGGAKIPGSKV